jgi:hypothetical protein
MNTDSQHDIARRFQFRLSTLLLLIMVVALTCATIVPRTFNDRSQPGIVEATTQRGFPFIYAEDLVRTYTDGTHRSPEATGMRNLFLLAVDVMIVGAPIILILFQSRMPVDKLHQTGSNLSARVRLAAVVLVCSNRRSRVVRLWND